ncbi:MAG TPA: hypothetical protein VH596_13760 [Terriglobales bacterium]|jgi:hypothetical protein
MFICLTFALALTQNLRSQQMPLPPAIANPHGEEPNNHGVPLEIQRQMQKKANEQRQAEIKRDTDRLLKLSTELKEYVDKSNENVLSLDVMKKAEEIEKLARSVKNKMRGNN